ncbi:mobile mystery protein A [Eilatimonas milleporae]|uniref:Putative DNA-binding mobile mystery protein A n=1 Tax=Eilatimonas milleporae TaxID=911205 RepID=A0A3M0CJJ3_9PROT|nr:mobile mystery protein A [Eilatimonas milleporae]RMB09045.1 putative DNA-binding mobile mystery protein A [Eilatimonas milleporae]
MSIRNIVVKQYREKVNRTAKAVSQIGMPAEGWLCTARKALHMSAAELARRLGKSRALVSNTEKAELDGGVTLKTMQNMAEAMNCKFVYAIVPQESVKTILEEQAHKKAKQIVEATGTHMALEDQALSQYEMELEIERVARDLLHDMPSDFWRDTP